jgi:hypothetical protein
MQTMEKRDYIFVLGAILVYLLYYPILNTFFLPNIFYSVDEGMRFVQMNNYFHKSILDRSIDYPGAMLDPYMTHIASPFIFKQNLILVSQYSTFLPYIESHLYYLFNSAASYLIPSISLLLSTIAFYFFIKRKFGFSCGFLGSIMLGLASPALFYAFTTWDHTFALLLSTLFLICLERFMNGNKAYLAVPLLLIAAISITVRSESLLLYISAITAYTITMFKIIKHYIYKNTTKIVIVASILVFFTFLCKDFIFNFIIYHLYIHTIVKFNLFEVLNPINRMDLLNGLLFRTNQSLITNTSAILFIICSFVSVILMLKSKKIVPDVVFRFASIVVLIWTLIALIFSWSISGFFSAFPIGLIAILSYSEGIKSKDTFIKVNALTSVITLVLFILLIPANGEGQWGGRYLLVLIPFLCVQIVHSYCRHKNKINALLFLLLLLSCIFLQVRGLKYLYDIKQARSEVIAAFNDCNYILTDDRATGMKLSNQFLEGKIFYCDYTIENCNFIKDRINLCIHTAYNFTFINYTSKKTIEYFGTIYYLNSRNNTKA